MKIGIITILKVDNYGADLQAFALQRKLELMGYESEVIDYLYYKNLGHKRERASRPCFKYPFKFLIREKALVVKGMVSRIRFPKQYRQRQHEFHQFHLEHTKMTRCYNCYSELYSNPPLFDVYCVGSDQVWNPGNHTNLDPYFLTFAPKGKKKISYASSFGVATLPECSWEYYSKRLRGLDSVGVREGKGMEIVRTIAGRESQVVLDPTLLLTETEWETVEKPVSMVSGRYLLIYELKKSDYLRQLAKRVASARGLRIIRLCSSVMPVEKDGSVQNITTVGPGGFVYLFRHADFVVTNSFHGTAFSINFSKPFYSISSRGKANNSRQESLLIMCKQADRLLYDDMPMPSLEKYKIEYQIPQSLLKAEREVSLNYIRSVINA